SLLWRATREARLALTASTAQARRASRCVHAVALRGGGKERSLILGISSILCGFESKRKTFSARTDVGARGVFWSAGMSRLFHPVTIEQGPPRQADQASRETVMAQELKGSAFNILFTASFFASFAYFMLHFG
ncbi:MAG TPA: hypothetical protein VKU03_11850, partial [Roseiarcus sp.]|nr:hypothetical protein [Roseiarcus sp.]